MAPALVLLATLLLFTACGGGSGNSDNQPSGRLTFRLQWDRSESRNAGMEKYGTNDCSDVATVTAAAYDADGALLQTGGPWACGNHEAILTQVPANRYVSVAVAGLDASGTALYRGESSEPFFLPGGGTADAGVITAGTFGTTLRSPADGATVLISALTLAWTAVAGTDHYVVQIANSSVFDTDSIVQTLTVDPTDAPSCQPDTTDMGSELTYYWRVQAVDGAGNISQASASRSFNLSFETLAVTITSPTASVVQLGAAVTFTASVTDSDGNPLTADDLTTIDWYSDVNGTLSNQLSFSTDALAGTSHAISLYVEDPVGHYGSTSLALRVNNPPTATILSPINGYRYYYLEDSISCYGTATDPEDGNNTSTTSLQWQLFDSSGTLLDTFNGNSVSVPDSDNNGDGNYTVIFQVTDSDGGTNSQTVDFSWY